MAKTQSELLREELEQKRKELELLEKQENAELRKAAIKDLSEFTVEEKIEIFDRLYKSSLSSIEMAEENGYHDEDSMHYSGEEVMQIIARDRKLFWKYYNSIED